MLEGLRTYLLGYHNPILHTYYVTKAWQKIYGEFPNCREFICILFHDIGYIKMDSVFDSEDDAHPLMGAKICGFLFGHDCFMICAGHSRQFANNMRIPISSLCYADKYAVILIPVSFHRIISHFDNGRRYWNADTAKVEYGKWWNENGWSV